MCDQCRRYSPADQLADTMNRGVDSAASLIINFLVIGGAFVGLLIAICVVAAVIHLFLWLGGL